MIKLGGKERELKFDLGVMSDYEDLTGDNALMQDIFTGISSKKLRAMLFCVLKVDEPEITIDDCGKMVNASNIAEVLKQLGKAFNEGMPKSDGQKKSNVERVEFLDLWAVGVYDLGLSNEQWRRLTLLQYDALVKRLSNKIEREENRIAKLSAIIYNANGVKRRGASKKPWAVSDFLPKKETRKPWQEQLKLAEMLNKAFGGVDKRKHG